MNKHTWKIVYRMMRINIRESLKAWNDSIIYGKGFTKPDPDEPGCIKHIPAMDVLPEEIKAMMVQL
jgi:hypothetical protein